MTTLKADAAFLEQQRKRLNVMRAEIQSKAAAKLDPKGQDAKASEEDAQDIAETEIGESIDAVEEQRLSAIDRALAKIDDGTYGLSDLGGDPIPKGRLEAMPEALFTIEQEEAREKQQRQ